MCTWHYFAPVFRGHALIYHVLKLFQIMKSVAGLIKNGELAVERRKTLGCWISFFVSHDRVQLQENMQTRAPKHRIVGLHNLILAELTGDDFGSLQWWLAAGQLKKC